MKKYGYTYDGSIELCGGPIYAKNKKEAKEQYKKEHNVEKLPKGFDIWETKR